MKWLTIDINPPKLDVSIVARGEDKFGLGSKKDVFEFDSTVFTEEEAAGHLLINGFVYWLELPE